MDKRLTGMNEIRETMREQAGDFISRREYDAKHDLLISEIKVLREFSDVTKGKASQSALMMTALLSLAGFILGLVHLIRGL